MFIGTRRTFLHIFYCWNMKRLMTILMKSLISFLLMCFSAKSILQIIDIFIIEVYKKIPCLITLFWFNHLLLLILLIVFWISSRSVLLIVSSCFKIELMHNSLFFSSGIYSDDSIITNSFSSIFY